MYVRAIEQMDTTPNTGLHYAHQKALSSSRDSSLQKQTDLQQQQQQHRLTDANRSSRSPSAYHVEHMSRDRTTTISGELAGTVGSGSGAVGIAAAGGLNVATASSSSAATAAAASTTTAAPFRGFRSHSPTHRRSRERNRREFNRTHGSDQGGLLAYTAGSGGVMGAPTYNSTGGGGALLLTGVDLTSLSMDSGGGAVGVTSGEDSRLSGNEDLCYQSFASASDEPDATAHGSAMVTGDASGKKHHRRHERTSSLQALDRLNTKIKCTKESIRKEQTARDDNVNEYLKLASSADKQQLQRIKAVFEKKNQKSAHTISQLQKKLDNYTKRAKDLQYNNTSGDGIGGGLGGAYGTAGMGGAGKSQHRQPREVLRDVGQGLRNVGGNIRDGLTGLSGSVMSKPREFAHLIKNKFGSADNINQMGESEINTLNMAGNNGGETTISGTMNMGTSSGGGLAAASTGSGNTGGAGSGKFNSDNGSECSSVTSESLPAGSGKSQSGASQYHIVLKSLLTELAERKDEIEKLKERVDRLETAQKEFNTLTSTLESERYRAEGLEEQINDLTELHQNEIENLKQTIADMEEKVQYQSDERLRDVNEVLENCQTRISKMEHLSQQQYVTVEGIDNSNARALVVKLINVVLTILQVVLLLVATAAGIIMPFLKTRVRVLTTFFAIFVIVFVIRQWPDVEDIGAGLVRHLKESLVVK